MRWNLAQYSSHNKILLNVDFGIKCRKKSQVFLIRFSCQKHPWNILMINFWFGFSKTILHFCNWIVSINAFTGSCFANIHTIYFFCFLHHENYYQISMRFRHLKCYIHSCLFMFCSIKASFLRLLCYKHEKPH